MGGYGTLQHLGRLHRSFTLPVLMRQRPGGTVMPLNLVPGHGFEPRFSSPKADVLPLDDPAVVARRPACHKAPGHRSEGDERLDAYCGLHYSQCQACHRQQPFMASASPWTLGPGNGQDDIPTLCVGLRGLSCVERIRLRVGLSRA